MCHFITLIVPTGDEAALRTVMRRHGRTAEAIDNPSVRRVLRADERQYLTSIGECDCGTVLAPSFEGPTEEEEAARMAAKGWSRAKIDRALADRRKASARMPVGVDSFQLWAAVIADLQCSLRLPRAGLLLHLYSGGLEDEITTPRRRDAPSRGDRLEALRSLAPDEVLIFHA